MIEGRKLPSAALFATIFGCMLIMPPLVMLSNIHARLFGFPVEVIYIFAVWFGLVLATRWFARRLPREPAATDADS